MNITVELKRSKEKVKGNLTRLPYAGPEIMGHGVGFSDGDKPSGTCRRTKDGKWEHCYAPAEELE